MSTPLQRHVIHTLAPALNPEILCEALTDWLPSDTLTRFHSFGVSFRPLLVELVEWLPDDTLTAFIQYLPTEVDLSDLPEAPAPLVATDDDLATLTIA